MAVELKITVETMAELEQELQRLASLRITPSGLEPMASPTQETASPSAISIGSSTAETSGSANLSSVAPSGTMFSTTCSGSESIHAPPKKRGRPPKDAGARYGAASLPSPKPQTEPQTEFSGSQTPTAQTTASETECSGSETPTGSSGSSTATSASASPVEPVHDNDLNRYCSRLMAHFGGDKAKILAAAGPYVPEGAVCKPTSIDTDEKRWAFIRAMETETGVKYHG